MRILSSFVTMMPSWRELGGVAVLSPAQQRQRAAETGFTGFRPLFLAWRVGLAIKISRLDRFVRAAAVLLPKAPP